MTNFEAPETYFALFLQRILSQIFSLMNAKWTAERNRASVALIRSELQIYVNFGMTCSEFYSYVLLDNKLLNAAARNITSEGAY